MQYELPPITTNERTKPTVINFPNNSLKEQTTSFAPKLPPRTNNHIKRHMKDVVPNQLKTSAQFRRFINATNPLQGENTDLKLTDLQTNNNLDDLFGDTNHRTSPNPFKVHPGQVPPYMLEALQTQRQRISENMIRREIYKRPIESEDTSNINENFLKHRYHGLAGVYDSTLGLRKDDILSEDYNYQYAAYAHEYGHLIPRHIRWKWRKTYADK